MSLYEKADVLVFFCNGKKVRKKSVGQLVIQLSEYLGAWREKFISKCNHLHKIQLLQTFHVCFQKINK